MLDNTGIPGVLDFYDYLKHLTTLSTGALVILVSLAKNFSSDSGSKKAFVLSLVFFLAAVISSVVCMLFVLSGRRYIDSPPLWERIINFGAFLSTLVCLIAGLVNLTIFGISNFPKEGSKSRKLKES